MDSIAPVVWGVQNENLLTAIPLFVLLGELLLRSGIADRMYVALSAWLGRLPGGLLHTNIGCCALFAATSGSSVATAATVGTVALPSLQKRGYPMRASLGSLAAGGTLGILIPPSVNMIVYGSLTNTSIGKLFIAGIIPGLLLTGCFMLWIWISSVMSGNVMREDKVPLGRAPAPAEVPGAAAGRVRHRDGQPLHRHRHHHRERGAGRGRGAVLRLAVGQAELEAAAHLLPSDRAHQRHDPADHHGGLHPQPDDQPDRRRRGDDRSGSPASGLSGTGFMLVLIVFYLVLGMFMDVLSMLVATIPITFPIVTALGVDPIWFGIFIVLMCELGLITPPVGMNLFVVHGIRPDKGGIGDAICGALPYAAIMILFTLLLIAVPGLATWLPAHM